MAIKRSTVWLSQARVDVPDLRALESAVRNDFDDLIKSFISPNQGYILRGFEINMTGAIGGAASGLQLLVDPGAVFHSTSSQAGTVFFVSPGTPAELLNSSTNSIVDGAFTPNAINYVGLEYERFNDPTTAAQVYFWNATTKSETTKTAPRAQVLRYRIKITTSAFASNVLPIATVTTDSGNNVTEITDARWQLFRLGQGGASPNPFYTYPWTAHSEGRLENPSTSTSSVSPFRGGDKQLGTFKDWMDAIMTSVQEIKGTTYWYEAGTAGSIESLRTDLGNTITTGKGIITHSETVAGQINWDEHIYVKVVGSQTSYKLTQNPSSSAITLADNEVAYITWVRDVEIAPNLIWTNSSAIVTSVGAVAWTADLQAGDFVKLSSTTVSGYYEILSVDSLTQVTLTTAFTGTSTGASGAKSKYSFGTYQASLSPSTNRHIYIADRASVPQNGNVFWFLYRSDNGGVIPKVYVRFLGSELEMGESEEIDDGVPRQLLTYIGAPLESSSKPAYVSALNPGSVAEITDITLGNASTITSNQYFFLYSSADSRRYYVWFNKDGTGTDPAPYAAYLGIEVTITTGQTDAQVALALETAINSTTYPDFTTEIQPTPNVLRITNNSAGTCSDAANYNVGAPFAISVVQQGTGDGNYQINDGDNLTLAIKKLDEAFGLILASLDDPSYDETVDIVTSGEVPPDSLNGPVLINSIIDLPLNSRMSNIQQYYTVGLGTLCVYLNGQYLRLGSDWNEVGSTGAASYQIEILQQLEVGDSLEFRISAGGAGAGGGGGGTGPMGPAGPPGAAGADALNGPANISTKNASYTVTGSDNVLLADCTSGDVTFTLPTPGSGVGQVWYFKKIDSSSNNMYITVTGGANIDGSTTQSTNVQYASFTIISNGTQYWIL